MERREWPLWEVFIRSKGGLDHKHCGSVHAPDAKMALSSARDVYTGRVLWKRDFADLGTMNIYHDDTYADTPLSTSYNRHKD